VSSTASVRRLEQRREPELQLRFFFADDGTDEIIYADIDGGITVFVFGCNRVRCSFELLIETLFVGIQKGLFLRRERCLVTHGRDELLREMRGVAERGHVRSFAEKDGIGFVVTGMRDIGLKSSDFGDITVVVMESLAAFHRTVFGVRPNHFLYMGAVFDFSHG